MNKKVVFLVVLLECILAVFLVSIFGHALEDARRQILCEEIYFVDEHGEKIEDGEMIEFTLTDTNISYQLHWIMITGKTSNREVVFESDNPMVKVNSVGLVTFLDDVAAVITVRTIDGSGKTDSITLIPKRGGGIVD